MKEYLNIDDKIQFSIGNVHYSRNEHCHYIFKKTNENIIKKIEKDNFIFYTKYELNNELFELIEISHDVQESFIVSLMKFLDNDQSINSSLNEIENFFYKNSEITLKLQRGIYAELKSLKIKDLEISHDNSIFDFKKDGNDFEIKSYSKVKQTIQLSYQQLSNSENAMVMAMQVYESNEGEDILELYKKLVNTDILSRYKWILRYAKYQKFVKFNSDEYFIFKITNDMHNVKLPKYSIDAKYEFSINLLKTI